MPAIRLREETAIPTSMKRPGLTPPLFAATLFLAAALRAEEAKSATPAATDPKPSPAVQRARRDAELLKRFDKNGDGMMTEQMDRQAARAAVLGGSDAERAKLLEMFDKNHDGKLDDEERAAAEKYARERAASGEGYNLRAEMIRRLDKNGDGKVDETERAAGVTYIAQNLDQFPGLKQRFDKNHDGKLDNDEQIALDEGLRQLTSQGPGPGMALLRPDGSLPPFESLPPRIREEALKRFDKDGDGKLTGDELTTFQAEMQRRRAERMAKNSAPAVAPGKAEEPPATDKEEAAKLNQAMEDFASKLDVSKPAPTK